ncbi:MAG: hypothetical protein R3F38_18575 [Gammaproteobacteria bacterium]
MSDCTWDHDTSWGLPVSAVGLTFSGLPLLQKGWRGEIAPLTAVCGALPAGRFDMKPFRQLINAHVPEGQMVATPGLLIMAVDNARAIGLPLAAPMHQAKVWSMRCVHPMPCRAASTGIDRWPYLAGWWYRLPHLGGFSGGQ